MDLAHKARERLGQQLAHRRRVVAEALARAEQQRNRALARGDAQASPRCEAAILGAKEALAALDAEEDESQL